MAVPGSNTLVNDVFGSYRVVHRIGEGGMGEVFLAEHIHMDRKAAIKVLRSKYSEDVELVDRFFAEARAANLIKHPSIVEIYDCAALPDGRAYIVMEYLEGQTLGAALERLGCIDDMLTIVDLSWQIATALQAAHDKSIIHRDLKPDNIFLTFLPEKSPKPVVKILDFGIAKLLHSTVKATQTGSMLGTPLYMSPEQARGAGAVDHRTDIYSLGCIMFEMATGRPPFVREGVGDLIIAHASEKPPMASRIQPSLPPELDGLINAMLAKKADDRPQTMQEVASKLNLFRSHRSGLGATDPLLPEVQRNGEHLGRNAVSEPPGQDSFVPQPRRRVVAPTEILPPADEDDRSPISVVRAPMFDEHSWIAQVRDTAREPRPRRRLPAPLPPPSESSLPEIETITRSPSLSSWMSRGALVGGAALSAILIGLLAMRLWPKSVSSDHPGSPAAAPIAKPAVPEPAPTPAPLATAQPLPAQAVPAKPPAPADRAKRPAHQPAVPAGPATEALSSARQAFKTGDYIAAGIQAKRAVHYGAGVPALLIVGDSMMRLESYEEARQAYQAILEVDPSNASAKRGLRRAKQKSPF
jgi:serine/threonine-protein kinase